MENVGERIKTMRIEKGWTQKDLALLLGLKNDTAIANYEANYSTPKDDIKYKLCELFNCTMDYLMGNSFYRNYKKNSMEEELEIEKEKLLYVELPNLIQRIIHLSMIPLPASKEIVELYIEDIKKITNTECESALSYLKL